MWKLIKSTVAYNWPSFLNLLAQSLFMFLFIHIYVLAIPETLSNKNVGYNSLHHMLIIFIVMIVVTPWGKEKRTRFFMQLPTSAVRIGLAHLCLHVIYWFSIVALFFLYCAVSVHYRIDRPALLALLSQTGIAFVVYSVVFIGLNLRESGFFRSVASNARLRKFFLFVIVFLVILFAALAIAGIIHIYQNYDPFGRMRGNIFTWVYFSHSGALAFLAFGFFLSIVSVVSFKWRKSYAG